MAKRDELTMAYAVQAVISGQSIRGAAKEYGIPESTLRTHVKRTREESREATQEGAVSAYVPADNTPEAIRSRYEEDVNHPGKFEGEASYVPYFWDQYLNGFFDEEIGDTLGFNVSAEDVAIFPDLEGTETVWLYERSDGFVIETGKPHDIYDNETCAECGSELEYEITGESYCPECSRQTDDDDDSEPDDDDTSSIPPVSGGSPDTVDLALTLPPICGGAPDQPEWELVANLGDVNPIDHGGFFVYRDRTGVYPHEAEILECVDNEVSGQTEWWVYRFPLERCVRVIDGVLSDNPYHPESPAWFADKLDSVAESVGMREHDFKNELCSNDPIRLANAYRAIADYYGIANFDDSPRTFNRRIDVMDRYGIPVPPTTTPYYRENPDTYIYDADVYCEACAKDIKRRIRSEGNAPKNPDDETSYDSSEWPKGPFSDEEADTPQHCGSGADCLDPHIFPSGHRAGKFLENPLTLSGEDYVRTKHKYNRSEVTSFWMEFYELDAPINLNSLDEFTDAYIECALWSTTDSSDESGGNPLDYNYGSEDIEEDTLREMIRDCRAFQEEHAELIKDDPSQAGHDFWLNRNGHGAGFWDGDWPEPAATILDKASKAYGSYDLYIGDDGKIYGN